MRLIWIITGSSEVCYRECYFSVRMECGKEHPGICYYSIGNVPILKLSGGLIGAHYIAILYPYTCVTFSSMY